MQYDNKPWAGQVVDVTRARDVAPGVTRWVALAAGLGLVEFIALARWLLG